MSGRVKVTLPSGRRVTGYRKTERTIETRGAHPERGPWVLSFLAPDRLLLSPGPTGVMGVTVTSPGPLLVASGQNRQWVFDQMRVFLDRIEAHPFRRGAVCRRLNDLPQNLRATRYLTYTPGKPLEWGRE
jgi:hypothetical protein